MKLQLLKSIETTRTQRIQEAKEFDIVLENLKTLCEGNVENMILLCEDATHVLAGIVNLVKQDKPLDDDTLTMVAAFHLIADPNTKEAIAGMLKGGENSIKKILQNIGDMGKFNPKAVELLKGIVNHAGPKAREMYKEKVAQAAQDQNKKAELVNTLNKLGQMIGQIQTAQQKAPEAEKTDVNSWFK